MKGEKVHEKLTRVYQDISAQVEANVKLRECSDDFLTILSKYVICKEMKIIHQFYMNSTF